MPRNEHIDGGEQKDRESSRALVAGALHTILETSRRIGERFGLKPDSIRLRQETDTALVKIAEHDIATPETPHEEFLRSIDSVAIRSALEIEDGVEPVETPINVLDTSEHAGVIEDEVRRLDEAHALLPDGHEVTPLVIQALEKHPDLAANVDHVELLPAERPFEEAVIAMRAALETAKKDYAEQGYWNYNAPELRKAGLALESLIGRAGTDDLMGVATAMEALIERDRLAGKADLESSPDIMPQSVESSRLHALEHLLELLPTETFDAMYAADGMEGWVVRKALMELTHAVDDPEQRFYMLGKVIDKVVHASGFGSIKDVYLAPRSAVEDDPTLMMIRKESVSLAYETSERLRPLSPEQQRHEASVYAMEFFRTLGLTDSLAKDMTYAMRGRIGVRTDEDDPSRDTVNSERLAHELLAMKDVVDTLGHDAIRTLSERAGIVNFQTIPLEQLRTTLGLIEGDPDTLDRLRTGDVSLLVRDATEDWNGAFANTAHMMGGSEGRNLVMELSSLRGDGAQLQSQLEALEEHGIKVSTLILGGHGAPGRIKFGDSWLSYRHIPKHPDYDNWLPLAESKSIKNLFSLLKAGQGSGAARVIIKSCSQASTENNQHVSTAIRVAREVGRAVDEPVEVYASEIATSVVREGDEQTARYKKSKARVYSVDRGGRMRTATADTIPLDEAFRR